MKKIFEKYMIIVGTFGSLVFYLQAIKIFQEKSATAVSLFAFTVGLVSVVSWMVYGIQIKDRALIISNVLATIGAVLVVTGIIIYKT